MCPNLSVSSRFPFNTDDDTQMLCCCPFKRGLKMLWETGMQVFEFSSLNRELFHFKRIDCVSKMNRSRNILFFTQKHRKVLRGLMCKIPAPFPGESVSYPVIES